jgi:2-dehydro-3-deoxyphosphooctonate aldolase (KDO 8-P synthase)
MKKSKEIKIGNLLIGGELQGRPRPFLLIAGPCVIEDAAMTMRIAAELKRVCAELTVPLVFKASYDKANRTSVDSYRGPGLDSGLAILKKVSTELDLPTLTDVHCAHDCEAVGEVVDCLQIPAYLCRQTDLLLAAGKSKLPVNIKKGQFMSPEAMSEAVKKVESTGNDSVTITERGVSFGYSNLVVDFRSIPLMREDGTPIIFDATHSVQRPSAKGKSSGGDREMIPYLARAAVAVGIDALFMEVHPEPDKALSDGPNSIALEDFPQLLKELKELDDFIKNN